MNFLASAPKGLSIRTFFLTALLLLLSLCSHFTGDGALYADEKDQKSIKSHNYDKLFSEFRTYAINGMKQRGIPGMAIAVVKDGKIIYSEAFGVKKAGTKDPVTVETVFQIGSTSKAFTSCLMAMMADEKKFDWNDKVIDHFPGFMMYDPWVTREFMIKDLMAQHSGLKPYSGDTLSFFGYGRDQIISNLRYLKPVSSFRSEFAYQNNLFLVAARIIEMKTCKSWEENVRTRIFEPLGMKNSTMTLADFRASANHVCPHAMDKTKAIPLTEDWKFHHWVYIYAPAGGINSNVIDMSKWLIFQINEGTYQNKQLAGKTNMHFLHTPQTVAARDKTGALQTYCQGWVCREYSPHPIIWHNGGTSGCNTMVAFIPEEKLGIVIFTNVAESSALPDALGFRFFDMYFNKPFYDWNAASIKEQNEKAATIEKLQKKTSEPVIINPIPESACTGKYTNNVYGNIEIVQSINGLTFKAGPMNFDIDLQPWSGNIYKAKLRGMDDTVGSAIFEMSSTGNVTGVTIDFFNQDGQGKFKKASGE